MFYYVHFFCEHRVALLKSTNDLIPDESVLLTVQRRGRTLPTLDLKPCKLDRVGKASVL